MVTARDIMRGTFRLSVVVAILVGVYGIYEWSIWFSKKQSEFLKLTVTLECGARLPENNLRAAVNQLGLVDLSKVGCASEPFRATFEEIQRARDGTFRREWQAMKFDLESAGQYSLTYALVALIAVNLLGLALVATRVVVGWIAAGYRPTP